MCASASSDSGSYADPGPSESCEQNDVKRCCCCCGRKNGEKLYIVAAAQVGPLIIAKQLAGRLRTLDWLERVALEVVA